MVKAEEPYSPNLNKKSLLWFFFAINGQICPCPPNNSVPEKTFVGTL